MITCKEALRAGYDLLPWDREWYHLARKQDFGLEVRFSIFLEELAPGQLQQLKQLAFPNRKN